MKPNLEVLLDENKFPYGGMTLEERNYCISILKSCKDISDSENRVDNNGKCEIVTLQLIKRADKVSVNGALTLGPESRWLEADIYFKKNKIIVDMRVTRINVNSENKVYTVLDEFTLENDNLKRISQYNYNMNNICDKIENEEMKGRLK